MSEHDPQEPRTHERAGDGLHAWRRLDSEPGEHMLLFRPRWDSMENPRTGEVLRRLVLETPDWVNVVALTPERELVCVRQYRFGTRQLTIEVPGGVVDPGEEHGESARRELREETGYTSERWTYLGCVEPNPAFQDNLCHHWLAEDVRRTHPQELDRGEDIQVLTLSADELRAHVASGEVRHSLVLCALLRLYDLRSGRAGNQA